MNCLLSYSENERARGREEEGREGVVRQARTGGVRKVERERGREGGRERELICHLRPLKGEHSDTDGL